MSNLSLNFMLPGLRTLLMTNIQSWKDRRSLYNDFSDDGKLTGEKTASSPEAELTVEGAFATTK